MRRPLKQLHEIFESDPRSRSFVRLDAAGQHPKTIGDHYKDIAAIRMTDRVPKKIRGEFETVRNLYLYSWYVYEFTVPAILYAHALIENAIKEKCSRCGVALKGHRGLSKLLKVSIRKGWITNADFGFALEWTHERIVPTAAPNRLPALRPEPRYFPTDTDFCEHLAETLPRVRNMGAHGEAGLGFPASSLHSIEICACIANALFRDSDSPVVS